MNRFAKLSLIILSILTVLIYLTTIGFSEPASIQKIEETKPTTEVAVEKAVPEKKEVLEKKPSLEQKKVPEEKESLQAKENRENKESEQKKVAEELTEDKKVQEKKEALEEKAVPEKKVVAETKEPQKEKATSDKKEVPVLILTLFDRKLSDYLNVKFPHYLNLFSTLNDNFSDYLTPNSHIIWTET